VAGGAADTFAAYVFCHGLVEAVIRCRVSFGLMKMGVSHRRVAARAGVFNHAFKVRKNVSFFFDGGLEVGVVDCMSHD